MQKGRPHARRDGDIGAWWAVEELLQGFYVRAKDTADVVAHMSRPTQATTSLPLPPDLLPLPPRSVRSPPAKRESSLLLPHLPPALPPRPRPGYLGRQVSW